MGSLRGCSMNEKYIFIWNKGHIWKIDLETQERSKMDVTISEDENDTWVKRVRTGSDSSIVCIRVTQSP